MFQILIEESEDPVARKDPHGDIEISKHKQSRKIRDPYSINISIKFE